MNQDSDAGRAAEIVRGLLEDTRYNFHEKGAYLRGGICPACGKKELYVSKVQPWRIACSRENKCGSSFTAKELLPHLFENYAKRFPPTPENPKATADAYLMEDRGFLMSRCRSWYDQEGFRLPETGEFVPTARFYLDAERTRYWERLIGKTKADGQKANFGGQRKPGGRMYQGDAWTPPGQILESGDQCFITEGIFHAIALEHTGKKVAAALSSNNFPVNLIESNKGKDIEWVLALDGDHAGRKYMKKHRLSILEMDEKVTVCLLPGWGKDWDDLWYAKKLDDAFFAECFYRGLLFTAGNPAEKAWRISCRYPSRRRIVMEFGNALYSIKIDSKFSAEMREEEIAMASPEGFSKFQIASTIDKICSTAPEFLYLERNPVLEEQKYIFRIRYENGTPEKNISVDGTSLAGCDALNKALLNHTNGVRFTGDAKDFSILTRMWLDAKMKVVQNISYIGYHKDTNAWVFNDNAFLNGKKIRKNEHGFFDLNGKGVRPVVNSETEVNTDGSFDPAWLPDYIRAFSYQGLAVLVFWLGSLFAQQIRKMHSSFPFLEFTGDAGSGKSTVLEFNWKLVGLDDYEGFNILKATKSARRRNFGRVSNLPVVMIESDVDGIEGHRPVQFNFTSLKDLFNGRSAGAIGVATQDNKTAEQPFLGSLIISQNAEVDGEEAILSRIVHVHADKKHFTQETRSIARWFESRTTDDVGGFLPLALKNEKKILETYVRAFDKMERFFEQHNIGHHRVLKCHAQVAAMAHALPIIFPNMTQDMLDDFIAYLGDRALSRQERIAADNPLVEKFWETFHYINSEKNGAGSLDHSSDDRFIAVNLNHFRAQCVAHGQEIMDMTLLKRLLPKGKKYKFVESNRSVWGKALGKTIRCWVFKKE